VKEVEQALKTLADGAPVYLINTHWHGDHTGGNPHFGKQATIIAHENVRRRLVGDESIGGRVSEEALPAEALPTITYAEGVSLRFNGEEIRLSYVGGGAHTDGDTVVWFTGSNVVHMGDVYFQAGYPFVDTNSGGDVRGIIAAVEQVLETVPEDARIIPGHGEVTGTEGLRDYLEMLRTITGRVEELLAEGFTVDEMMEAEVTAEFDERWGSFAFVPPRRFVESVVTSLSR
jgi:cyclase